MGCAVDRVLDLANAAGGRCEWHPHPAHTRFIEIELTVPDNDEPYDGAGPNLDEAALNLIVAHFPGMLELDEHLAALANEHEQPAD